MKQLIQNTRHLLRSNVIQSNFKYTLKSNYQYGENMGKFIFDDGPVLEDIPNSQHNQVEIIYFIQELQIYFIQFAILVLC